MRGDLLFAARSIQPVTVLDLSAEGARIVVQAQPILPARLVLRLTLADAQVFYDAQLLWRRGMEIGLGLSRRREILDRQRACSEG